MPHAGNAAIKQRSADGSGRDNGSGGTRREAKRASKSEGEEELTKCAPDDRFAGEALTRT